MLTSISWQQYLLAVTALIVVYYFVVLLLYYKKDITAFFKRRVSKRSTSESGYSHSILGEVKHENDQGLLSSEELQFHNDSSTNSQLTNQQY